MSITHEERWEQNLAAVKQYIEENKCIPSKHRIGDHRLLNWLKYNRKMIAQGKLSAERQKKFEQLQTRATDFRKLNQYSYTSGKSVQPKEEKDWPKLF